MSKEFGYRALILCGFLILVHGAKTFSGAELGFTASEPVLRQFFTSFLAHSDLEHLLNNLFFIGLFGTIYESMTSSRTMLATFLVSAIVANLSAFVFFPQNTVLGASGGAFGILAAASVYRPNAPGLALGIPVPMWAGLVMYTVINLAGMTGSSVTAHEAHLLGIVAGAAIGLYLREDAARLREEQESEPENWRETIRRWEERYMLDSGDDG